MTDPAVLRYALWALTILLFARVGGQLLVATRAPQWLPPMEQWQSGLLPYPVLVAGQCVVLFLMVWISIDFSRGAGFWVEPWPALGRVAVGWSVLYVAAMVVRYIVRMTRQPDERWLGGTIPIIFHSLVAVFQFLFGMYHASLG